MHDDLAFAAELGLTHVRFDAPWALAQPKAGVFDGGVMESLVAAAIETRRLGLQPWFRLLQPAIPQWFDNERGFTDTKTAGRWWPRWVEHAAACLGTVAAGWVPIEAPFGMVQRLAPDDPRTQGELFDTLTVAWRDAWRILRGGPPVATSIDLAREQATGPTQGHLDEARRREQLRWGLWLDGLAHGRVRIPGRADRELPDLAGACNVLGIVANTDIAATLDRCAEQGPERPLALTFRPVGSTDSECAQSVSAMWRDVRVVATSRAITSVTATPFLDSPAPAGGPARLGLATAERRVKDAGEAFLAG